MPLPVKICSLITTEPTPGSGMTVLGAGLITIGVPLMTKPSNVVPAAELLAVTRFEVLVETVRSVVAEMPSKPRAPRFKPFTVELLLADDWVAVEMFVDVLVITPVVNRLGSPVLRTVCVPPGAA